MSNPQKPDRRLQSTESQRQQAAASRETNRPADSNPVVSGQFAKLPAGFGRYQVEKLLGRGAMGAVYLARDTQLDRLVALKIPKVAASGSKRLLLRLETEAKAAARLDHPSLCKVFDAGEFNGQCFIAMQYIEGETLKTQLEVQGKSVAEAVPLILQLAEGLSEAHALGIIHRDLKPENIMINRRGTPVIMDFGLAKFSSVTSSAVATQAGTILGSPAYMSPEQASGSVQDIDQRSDIYSLGIIFFELLTGKWPFDGSAMQILGQKSLLEPPSPLDLRPDLPSQLAAICLKMIAKANTSRYQAINEVIADLRQVDLKFVTPSSAFPIPELQASASAFPDGAISVNATAQIASIRNQQNGRSTEGLGHSSPDPTTRNRHARPWWNVPAIKWIALGGAALLPLCGVIIFIINTNEGGTQTTVEVAGPSKVVIKTSKSSRKATKKFGDESTNEASPQALDKGSDKAAGGTDRGNTEKVASLPSVVQPVVELPLPPQPAEPASGSQPIVAVPEPVAASDVLPVGTVFKGKWVAHENSKFVAETRHTMKVTKRDGNQFVLEWELHDFLYKWIFEGKLSGETSSGAFSGEFTQILRSVDGIDPHLGNNEVQGNISADGKEISGNFVFNGTFKTGKWTATRGEQNPSSKEAPVQVGIKNGNFASGLKGWEVEGGAAAFHAFRYEAGKAVSTFGTQRERDTGRIFQTFKVPDKATTLSWNVHGGRLPGVYVSLLRGDSVYKRATGLNNNVSTRVVWDVTPLRGETVTLELVDKETANWGFIGASQFAFDAKN